MNQQEAGFDIPRVRLEQTEVGTMGKLLKLSPIILVCLILAHCGERCTSPCEDTPRELSQEEQRVVDAYNAFGFKLLREIIQEAPADTNVFVSPLSVSLALGMTLNGAREATAEAMKSTLEFPNMEMQKINECYESLMELLPGLDPEVKFEIANSIWYRLGEQIREEFLNDCESYFDAEVTELDFSRPDAASTINGWVEDKTHGKIKNIVEDPIRGVVVMFLIDAIYFKGTWTYEFDPDLTQDDWFRLPDGSQARCRMMARPESGELAEFEYFENKEIQAIDLPYADGWYSMTIILPREGVDLNALIAGIDRQTWEGWMSAFETREGELQMPKFETQYDIELRDALTALGMGIAFSCEEADFSGIRESGGLWIDKVKHKTYVKVDEAGTEAAAVTVVVIIQTTVPGTFTMRVDRPFLFAIREKHSGTVLFIGKIGNPGYPG